MPLNFTNRGINEQPHANNNNERAYRMNDIVVNGNQELPQEWYQHAYNIGLNIEQYIQLVQIAQSYNISVEDVLFYNKAAKSQGVNFENYMYQLINKIPQDQYEPINYNEMSDVTGEVLSGEYSAEDTGQHVRDIRAMDDNEADHTAWGQDREYLIRPEEFGVIKRASNTGYKLPVFGDNTDGNMKHYQQPTYGSDQNSDVRHSYKAVDGVSEKDFDEFENNSQDLKNKLYFN